MCGEQVKQPQMGALLCLATLVLFLQTGLCQSGVLQRTLVAAASQMTAGKKPDVSQSSTI